MFVFRLSLTLLLKYDWLQWPGSPGHSRTLTCSMERFAIRHGASTQRFSQNGTKEVRHHARDLTPRYAILGDGSGGRPKCGGRNPSDTTRCLRDAEAQGRKPE